MKTYIGTKIINAEPCSFREWCNINNKNAVGLSDKEGYKVVYEDGYVSWSPKDVFERSYREITTAEKQLIG